MEKTGKTISLGWLLAGVASGTAFAAGKVFLSLMLRPQRPSMETGELNLRVNSLVKTVAELNRRTKDLESNCEQAVSRRQLDSAVEKACLPLTREMEVRFRQQGEAVEALRIMIGRTDELLGRVLDHLESADRPAAG